MALSEAMKIQRALSRMHQSGDRQVCLVARYDRTSAPTERLHREDFCQALGIKPELKYQNDGGLGPVQCFAPIRAVTGPSAPHVLRLLDYVIFNALIGNHDAHANNFALLYSNGTITRAPLSDALSTVVYPELTAKNAHENWQQIQVQ